MKKIIQSLIFISLFCFFIGEIRAEKLKVGAKFPVAELGSVTKNTDNKIVVFIPSLTDECEYASMLTQSFYYYFDRQMAFEGLKKSPTTQIFLIVHDKQEAVKSPRSIIEGMNVIYDEKGSLFTSFGLNAPAGKNDDSTVVLLDSQNNVAHLDEHYRSQGEHLKPLENKLKQLNGLSQNIELPSSRKPLKLGDIAPDFKINDKQKLSDLRGEVVLISFYPAAFSGILPKSEESDSSELKLSAPVNPMSCSFQISSLSLAAKPSSEAKRIVISGSTASLLSKWQEVLGTHDIEYANDPDYSISAAYLSYNPAGYNNRVSVIVDRQGKIAYVDKDFDFNDETVLTAKMDELLKKGK